MTLTDDGEHSVQFEGTSQKPIELQDAQHQAVKALETCPADPRA